MKDRRNILSKLAGFITNPQSINISNTYPRPPGALPEKSFLQACTRCGGCSSSCPHGTIGKREDGTPVINPNRVACHLCDKLPCVNACLDGALFPLEREFIFIGLAQIIEKKCLPYSGPECGICRIACPINAISMKNGLPNINTTSCLGCGLCREACPVWDGAIVIEWDIPT